MTANVAFPTADRRQRNSRIRIAIGCVALAMLILWLFWYFTPTIGGLPLKVIEWSEMTSSIEVGSDGKEMVATFARMRRGKSAENRKAACVVKLPEGTESRWIEDGVERNFGYAICGNFEVIHSGNAGRVVDRATQQEVFSYTGGPFFAMAASPDGRWFAGRNRGESIQVWDVRREDPKPATAPCESVNAIAFAKDVDEMYVVTDESKCEVWRLPTLERIASLSILDSSAEIPVPIQEAAFSESRTMLAILNIEGTVAVWNIRDRKPIVQFKAHELPSPERSSLCFAANDRVLLTSGPCMQRQRPKLNFKMPFVTWPKRKSAEIVAWDVHSWRAIERWAMNRPARQMRSIPGSSLFVTLDSDVSKGADIAIRRVSTR